MINALAHVLLVPPGLLFAMVAGGLLLSRWRPGPGRALSWSGALLLLLLSLPLIERPLVRAAGDYAPFATRAAAGAQAIVVLAAEARAAPEFEGGFTVADLTLERLRYGARLSRRTGLPLLLSGGSAGSEAAPPLAVLMQASLREDFGLDAQWLETRSRNTRENAQASAEILVPAGVQTVVLVTDDTHLRRALAEFEAAGLHALPAPVRVPAVPAGWSWADLRPGIGALRESSIAIYELAGQAAQGLDPPPAAARAPQAASP